jgi:hypothetical protein
LGGYPDFVKNKTTVFWPHFALEGKLKPLRFLGQVRILSGKMIYVYIGAKNADSSLVTWEYEDSANVALVEGGETPSWIVSKKLDSTKEVMPIWCTLSLKPDSDLPIAPDWLQGDAVPEEVSQFVIQFDSNVKVVDDFTGSETDIGFAGGSGGNAYVFWDGKGSARVGWQSA